MRIKPILTLALMAGALALSSPALTLGLGKLTVQSSLGQPLSARIELTSATKEELDSLAAKVADPALYRQNSLAYQGVLARSRVTLERGPSGQATLVVTTPSAVNEPYLDLMVELNWAAGRLVRSYTFLLDPPGVAAPPVEPVAPVRSGVAPPRSAPAAAAAPAASPPASVSPAAPATATRTTGDGGESYTVQRGDTLSKIATEHKPPNITLDQMLVAMFRNNQGAFDANNINRLRAGSIINIPGADEAAATPAPEANKVVKVHSADWRAYRDRVAASAPVSEGAGTRGTAGKIGTAVEETAPAAAPGRDQLKVSRATEPGKAANVASEEAIARNNQIKEAQARIAELEKTVKDLQRAAELKSQALAMLQAQAEAAKGQPQKSAVPAAAPEPRVAEPTTAAPAKSADTSRGTEPAKMPEPAKVAEPAKVGEPAPLTAAKADDASKAPMKAAGRAEDTPKAAKVATKSESAPKAGTSFIDDLMTNTPTWAIGAGALALLAGIAVLLAARRRKAARYEEGLSTDTDIKTNTVFGSTGGGVVNTGDNSLSSEFSREGLGSIDTDEVDPIAEAEVYLAYGRDAQAEEILKDALKKDPLRQEIYLKLLEIHAQHNKPSAFETVASELHSVSHGEGEIWQKASALGRQLDPNNPMFAAADGAAIPVAGAAAGPHAFSVPSDFKPGALTSGHAADNIFDRNIDDDIALSSGAQPKSASDILAGAKSELEKTARSAPISGEGIGRTAAAAATAALVSGIAKGKSGDLRDLDRSDSGSAAPRFGSDLDFHLDESEKPAPMHVAAPPVTPASAGAGIGAKSAEPHAPTDLDKLDFSFNDDRSTFEDATPSVLDGQWHDSATKLDLAKAYQEMGDVEGAREILREVLAEGDSEQKTEAQALIAKLP